MKAILDQYLKELTAVARQGDAREESFYPALARMLEHAAHSTGTGKNHVRVTTQPAPTDAGNPDFRLWNGADRIIGYIEAKKPAEERLDIIEQSEGGYQVCEKWLKDRRLELDDIPTYCRMVTALGLTIDIQKEIDTIYPDIEASIVTLP